MIVGPFLLSIFSHKPKCQISYPDQLEEVCVPVPTDWQVLQDANTDVLFRLDLVAHGALVQVPGQQVRWGVCAHSLIPTWHFCPVGQPLRQELLLCPTFKEVLHSFSTLGVLAGLSPLVVSMEGDENPRRSVGLPWMDGWAAQFLQPISDWWTQSAVHPQTAQPPHPSPHL